MSAWTEEERQEALRRRMEGAAMAPAALPGGGLRFVSKGEAQVSDTGTLLDDFVDAESFQGAKEGFVFKMGRQGLGYYKDHGPGKGDTDFELNDSAPSYDMEKHARGETDANVVEPPEPGEGRVGALGDLLAENKAKKQEAFEKLVHDNRFQPPKGLDDDEADFLAQKERERMAAQRAREAAEREAEIAFKIAQQEAEKEVEKQVDITKIMGLSKSKKVDNKQSTLLSKLINVKRNLEDGADKAGEPPDKKAKAAEGGGNALMGLAAYDDDDDDDD